MILCFQCEGLSKILLASLKDPVVLITPLFLNYLALHCVSLCFIALHTVSLRFTPLHYITLHLERDSRN